jgi:hypothetical protein
MIKWLRADRVPCYVLLPVAVYREKAAVWHLPAPELIKPAGKS